MPTLYSDIATKQNTQNATTRTLPTEVGGRVRCAVGSVTPGTEAAGTIINLVKLPKGARILPSSKLYLEAGQNANITIKVGDAADDDRYLAAVAMGTSAAVVSLARTAALGHTDLAAEGWIFITTAVDALTAKYIAFEIFYMVD
jgi:hypothetical protein